MELKVSVGGVQRIVCGVTDKTTCQEVVIALAQALGRTGRYMLKEKFKEFERNVSPDERLLESLGKYGQHCREVQLTLLCTGPSQGGGEAAGGAPRWGSQQVCAPLRRWDVGGRGGRRGSGAGGGGAGGGSRRQSLPPLSQAAEERKPKRKSLTLVEEAFGWLESLSRSGKTRRGREKEAGKEPEKKRKGRTPSSDSSPAASRDCWSPGGVCGMGCQQRPAVTARQPRTSFLEDRDDGGGGEQDRDGNGNRREEASKDGDARRCQELDALKVKADRKPGAQPVWKASVSPPLPPLPPPALRMEEEEETLRALLAHQRARLHELQLQLDSTDAQIRELEEARAAQEADGEPAEEESEEEELAFWENELRAEEGYERDLQEQFLEMKQKAAECKAKLEEYRGRLQGRDLTRGHRAVPEAELPAEPKPAVPSWTKPHAGTLRQDADRQQAGPSAPTRAEGEKTPPSSPTEASSCPRARVSPRQTADPQGAGAGQLREWWARLSDAQNQSGTRPASPVLHRSEITIHLSSTRV
ncbi:ras association domain-containing protein 8 [Anguilla rostrata]|uniref:ras association domain-containing protein 8 n=1 Tax=Anguilla rostrata TaxID=7938 RepID=UPI0030D00A2E